MNLSSPFIERPIATLLLMVAIVLCGALAYVHLPTSALPEVPIPTIQVITRYPGANADTMSSTVSAPLERRLGQMPGLQQMNSTSSQGLSTITLQFTLGTSLPGAEQEVQRAINAAEKLLPNDLPAPPIYSKVNPGDAPVLSLALTSDTLPLTEVQDIADTRLAQKLSQISGVGRVSLLGGQRKAIVIEANSAALASTGRSLETVRKAVSAANQNLPKGRLEHDGQSYAIGGNDQLIHPSDYRQLVLETDGAKPLLMSSVARVSQGPEQAREAAWSNGRPIIALDIQRQPGANVIQLVDRIRALLPVLQDTLPASVHLDILADRTESIRASVRGVQHELVSAVALVVMVIFLFLRNLRATIIPALSVPVTLIGTFAVMHVLGFSLNNLTLMALTIATGFVVDDAIVVLENIVRHMERGASAREAAHAGSRQIGFTIVSLSLALVAVQIPLIFMPGVVGELFREFALTLAIAVTVSAFVSLVLTPMLCGQLLRPAPERHEPKPDAWSQRLERVYRRALRVVLARSGGMILSLVLTIALAAIALWQLPKGLFPIQDTGMLVGLTQARGTVSFSRMSEQQQQLAGRLAQDPAVERVTSFLGVDPANASLNQGRLLIRLKPAGERAGAQDVAARLQALQETGLQLFLHPMQDLALDPQGGTSSFRIGLQAGDMASLTDAHRRLMNTFRGDAMFTGVFSQTFQFGEELALDFDREAAARFGVTHQQISDALYDTFGERQISTVFTPLTQYRVILKAAQTQTDIDTVLDTIWVRSGDGHNVQLSAMVRPELRAAPLVLARQNQLPYADVSFNLAPNRAIDAALARLEQEARGIPKQPGLEIAAEGTAKLYQDSLRDSIWLVVAALIVVYILMGVLYESLVHPLTILSTLPAASLGALLALWLSGFQFDVVALIGIVLLVGIVMKNAIMMIDFALELERSEGRSPIEAITEAAVLRLRPILMTTVASIVGALPLAFGVGMGSELRHPMGIAIVGGLIVSQLLTLFSTPVVYLLMHRAGAHATHWLRTPPTSPATDDSNS